LMLRKDGKLMIAHSVCPSCSSDFKSKISEMREKLKIKP
jgi:hypothetical protein